MDIAANLACEIFPTARKCNSPELDVYASVDTSLLEGPSFGLAIFISLIGTILNTGTRDDVSFTGAITTGGNVDPVGDVDLKIKVASDEKQIVIPYENEITQNSRILGPKLLTSKHVSDVLWLGLGSDYLFKYLIEDANDPWTTAGEYLNNCLNSDYLPYELGVCARRAFLSSPSFTSLYKESCLQWTTKVLALAPLSDPNPTNILQAILCDLDFSAVLSDNPDLLEKHIAILFKQLAINGSPKESINLLNLFFLLRNSKEVLGSSGPLRSAILDVQRELEEKKDLEGLECIFGGFQGLAQRIRSSDIPETDLYTALKNPPLETVIIHDRRGAKVDLARFLYRYRGRPLDYENDYPMALFDSSSTVPDYLRSDDWNQEKDAVFSHPEGVLMARNFTYQAFDLNRFDSRLLWRDGVGCWPPSIDSLHFLSDIYNSELHICKENGRILDLCCGCGVVGIALSKISKLQDIRFLDIEPTACGITKINISENFDDSGKWVSDRDEFGLPCKRALSEMQGEDVQVFTVYTGEATSILTAIVGNTESEENPFERTFFTPPYVPEPNLLETSLWRATAGTELLEWVIQNAHSFTSELIVAYSSIAEHAVKRAIKSNSRISDTSLLGEHWVALRIPGMVELFEAIPNGSRKGLLSERAETYWNMYLHSLESTEDLHNRGLLPHHGHGFKFAHQVKSLRIVFD